MPKPVKVYTTSYCGYCRMAKALLASRKVDFVEVDVTADSDQRDWLVKETGRMTVPQIFIGDEAIGGFQELRALDESGELETLIRGGPT